jgi:RimJ/RimL family protein N-acetyltransferase
MSRKNQRITDSVILKKIIEYERLVRVAMNDKGVPYILPFEKKPVHATVLKKLVIESVSGKKSSNYQKIIAANQYNFTTARLMAREVCMDDLPDIHRLHSCPEVDEFNTLGIPKNLEETLQGIEPFLNEQKKATRKLYLWALSLKETGTFIGLAGLSLSLDKFRLGEMFYKFFPSAWGNGYATEIAKSLIERGFRDFHLHEMEAGVATGNTRSIRVLEKCGMAREGTRRKLLPVRGKWLNSYHYAIVEDDG